MTEEEAATKWCPFVRSQICGVNEDGRTMVISTRDAAQMVVVNDVKVMTHNCIGSACMAWRWDGPARWVTPRGPEAIVAARTPEEADAVTVRDGYCGLAGKP